MSKHCVVKATCSKCKKESDFTVWQSINVQINPEMKEKVLNSEAFMFKCPECGTVNPVSYTTLYHDMDNKLMIYLVPDDEKAIKETAQALSDTKNMSSDFGMDKDYLQYKFRIVTFVWELQEKIHIFDAGLDDRVIEIIKLLSLGMMSEEYPDDKIDAIVFDAGDDGENRILFIHDNKAIAHVPVPQKLYDDVARRFKDKIENNPQEYYIYDFAWARSLFGK